MFAAVRLARVLRPLRLMSRLSGMRMLVDTIIESAETIAIGLLMLLFLLVLFSMLAVQLWHGKLRSVCFESASGTVSSTWQNCGSTTGQCQPGERCQAAFVNPWFGLLNLDNVLGQSYSELQCTALSYKFAAATGSSFVMLNVLTLDAWGDVLAALVNAVGWSVLLIYLPATFGLAFFCTNLIGKCFLKPAK